MAGLQQQQSMLAGLGLLQVTLSVVLLIPPLGALPGDTKRSTPASVEVVKGLFSRAVLSLGYHKILEIPAGAQNITIRETVKSRNYLALGTGSGFSIINGNWTIDKPGVYLAAGTRLTYRRPNEVRSRMGESITAPGPITEELHLYVIYQKPGPSVYYEYSLLPPNTHPSPPDTPPEIEALGRRQVLWRCVDRRSQTTVARDLCGPALPPLNHEEDCNTQPCPAFWDLGEWSECSKRCGPGVQHRQVHCRQATDNNSNGTVRVVTVGTELCEVVTAMPETSSPCQLKICGQWQLRSDWSPCSVPCGVGQRSREVVCMGGAGMVEEDQECNQALKPDHLHNCDMGACARSWYSTPWSQRCSAECGKGQRTRASVCLVDHVTSLRLGGCEGERPQEVTSCDAGPCHQQVEWFTGPWGQCSAECGNGTQTRGVACLLRDEGLLKAVDQSKCSHLPEPISSQPCQLKLCGVQWYMTEWSACSRSCEGGYRVREVRCLADNMAPSDLCDPSMTPESSAECNPQPCVTDPSLSCRDQYENCVVVVQARLCVYPYYRTACCTSCARVANKHPYPYLKTHRKRHTLLPEDTHSYLKTHTPT